jgi:hypothetical protein
MVQPYDDEFTFYMNVTPRANGQLGAFLRNPERNQARFIGLDHLVRRGDTVYLKSNADSTIQTGILQEDKLSVYLRFATHDFQKIPPDSFTFFYARGRPTGTYTYTVSTSSMTGGQSRARAGVDRAAISNWYSDREYLCGEARLELRLSLVEHGVQVSGPNHSCLSRIRKRRTIFVVHSRFGFGRCSVWWELRGSRRALQYYRSHSEVDYSRCG